jgi:hypothetical protein
MLLLCLILYSPSVRLYPIPNAHLEKSSSKDGPNFGFTLVSPASVCYPICLPTMHFCSEIKFDIMSADLIVVCCHGIVRHQERLMEES